ncbi:MAG: hypothetical protein F4107_05020 [Gemmatimonadetes bacterium]|nr:hypothetical protein [Gemmatimonadota bacterium]MXX36398.1 hypothetical protein [Gemmatimonadota bacterium]MYD13289.1 hypothetical protein [Gemmatimonadota bacterium]MYI65292.1 hypothetical protein [Gemmatimonadota bacterium]
MWDWAWASAGRGRDYASVWSRNTDPAAIVTGRNQRNAEEIAHSLAGTSSSGRDTMEDVQAAYQLLAGFDYPLADAVSVDLRVRWTVFDEFSGTFVWDPLRGHVPKCAPRRQRTRAAIMSTDDFSFVGLELGLKYHF